MDLFFFGLIAICVAAITFLILSNLEAPVEYKPRRCALHLWKNTDTGHECVNCGKKSNEDLASKSDFDMED